MPDEPATPSEELQAAGDRLLGEVMVVTDGGHANVRGIASPETVRAAEAALARYDGAAKARAGAASGGAADELAEAIRSLLPIVHEQAHPEWDKRVERLGLAVYHHSWAVE